MAKDVKQLPTQGRAAMVLAALAALGSLVTVLNFVHPGASEQIGCKLFDFRCPQPSRQGISLPEAKLLADAEYKLLDERMKALCHDPKLVAIYSKMPCFAVDLTSEHLSDDAFPSNAERASIKLLVTSWGREVQTYSSRLGSGGDYFKKRVKATTKWVIDLERDSLPTVEGRRTWAEIHRWRMQARGKLVEALKE
jgi:hypothetical protein